MLKLDNYLNSTVKISSATVPAEQVKQMLAIEGAYFPSGHYLYPVTVGEKVGNHLDSLFLIEPIVRKQEFVNWIVEDICRWLTNESLTVDVVFAPAQEAVVILAMAIAKRIGARTAFWEYTKEGWFGNSLVSGQVKDSDRILILNGVTQQGRCVGQRLPEFVEKLGGKVIGAAVFAKGTAAGVKATEERYGRHFYSMIQVEIKVASPADCQVCHEKPSTEPVPWTVLRDASL